MDAVLDGSDVELHSMIYQWGYGATAARLTPDQKVGSSNLSALTIAVARCATAAVAPQRVFPADQKRLEVCSVEYQQSGSSGAGSA